MFLVHPFNLAFFIALRKIYKRFLGTLFIVVPLAALLGFGALTEIFYENEKIILIMENGIELSTYAQGNWIFRPELIDISFGSIFTRWISLLFFPSIGISVGGLSTLLISIYVLLLSAYTFWKLRGSPDLILMLFFVSFAISLLVGNLAVCYRHFMPFMIFAIYSRFGRQEKAG